MNFLFRRFLEVKRYWVILSLVDAGVLLMSRFLEQLKVYLRVLLLNRRSTILAFIGLGFSLALISEGLIFAYSFPYGAFEEYAGEPPTKQLTVSLSGFFLDDDPKDVKDFFYNITNDVSDSLGVSYRIRKFDWFFEKGRILGVQAPAINGSLQIIRDCNIYGVSYDYFSAFQTLLFNGSLPSGSEDVLVVAKKNVIEHSNLSNIGLFPLYVPSFGGEQFVGPINVSGIITKEQFGSYNGSFRDDFQAMLDYFTDQFMLINIDNFPPIVSIYDVTRPIGRYSFYLEEINSFDINTEIALLNSISQELTRVFEREGFSLHVYNELSILLRDFANEFRLFQLFGIIFLVPLIVVSVALSSFSAKLLKQRQRQHISNLFQRGSTQFSIWFMLFLQLLEVTVSGIIFSLAIGYPFSWLMLKSTGFLAFSKVGVLLAVNGSIFYIIIGAAFVLSFFINLKDVWDFSKISLVEAHQETQQKKPFWSKLYLDVVLLVIGLTLWLIVKFPLQGSTAYIFAYSLGIIAPVAIVLGGILLTARLYLLVLQLLAKPFWRTDRLGVIGLAIKRSSRRKHATMRGVVLVALTFSLVFSALISVESFNQYEEEKAYYSLGADILIKNVDGISNVTRNQILAVTGVQETTFLSYTSQIVTFGSLTYSYFMIGINPLEYARTAYFDTEYLGGKSPEEFFGAINASHDVVMQKEQLDKGFTLVQENISLPGEKYPVGIVSYDLHVVGIYNFLPRFFTEYPPADVPIFRFTVIGNYSLVDEVAYSPISIGVDAIVKVAAGHSITQVAKNLETELGLEVENVIDKANLYAKSFRNTMLYGSVNTTLIFSFLILTASILLSLLSQLVETEREIRMLRVVGFSPKQFFSLFLSEVGQSLVFSAIISSLVGGFAAKMIVDLLTFNSPIPPSGLSFPMSQLVLSILSLIVVSLLMVVIAIRIIFRKETHRESKKSPLRKTDEK